MLFDSLLRVNRGRLFVSWCALLALILELGFSSPPTNKAVVGKGEISAVKASALPALTLSFFLCGYRASQAQQIEDEQALPPSNPCPSWHQQPEGRHGDNAATHKIILHPTAPYHRLRPCHWANWGRIHHGSGCWPCLPTHYCLDSCRAGRALLGSASPLPLSLFFLSFIFVYIYWAMYYCSLFLFNFFFIAHPVMQPWLRACLGMLKSFPQVADWGKIWFFKPSMNNFHNFHCFWTTWGFGKTQKNISSAFLNESLRVFLDAQQPLSTKRFPKKKHISHTWGTRTKHTVLQFVKSLHGLG